MPRNKAMEQFFSYFIGVLIAAALVGGMIFCFYLTSDEYANARVQNELANMTIDQLVHEVDSLNQNAMPVGRAQQRVLGAIIELGNRSEDIPQQVRGLSTAALLANSEYGAAALVSLKNIGPPALPVIEAMARDDDGDQFTRSCSMIHLLGEDAAALTPTLIEMIDSSNELKVASALFAMENFGEHALPAVELMRPMLASDDMHRLVSVCRICAGLGRDAAPLAKELEHVFNTGVISSRSLAGVALGSIGPVEDVDTVALLRSRLDAFAQVDKQRALIALALMGDEAQAATEDVTDAMNDPARRVQPQAAWALYRITGETEGPVQVLTSLLPDPNYRSDAMLYLGKMGADAAAAVDSLTPLLDAAEIYDRESAVIALGNIGPAAAPVAAKIRALADDGDALLRQAVQESLEAIAGGETDRQDGVEANDLKPRPKP